MYVKIPVLKISQWSQFCRIDAVCFCDEWIFHWNSDFQVSSLWGQTSLANKSWKVWMQVLSCIRAHFSEKNAFCILQNSLLTCTYFQYFACYLDTAIQSQMNYLIYHFMYFLRVEEEYEVPEPIGFPTQTITLNTCGFNDLIGG